MKVIAFGEILWDLIEGKEHLGGAPFNFAAHIAHCGHESIMISRVGKDQFGVRAIEQAQAHGVNVSLVQIDNVHKTGVVDVTLANGQPDYIIRENAAYDFIDSENVIDKIKKAETDLFYFGSLAQRNERSADSLLQILKTGRFKHVFYDVNLRKKCFSREVVTRSLGFATIFKLNMDEVPVLGDLLEIPIDTKTFCSHLFERYTNLHLVIVTAGEKGCYIYTRGEMHFEPATAVKVVDAVGAGDSFSAAFMHAYCNSGNFKTAAKVANQVGAFVASQAGAIPEYSAEIREVLGR